MESMDKPEGARCGLLAMQLIEDSTVIPAGKCALILDPDYTGGTSTQPYDIEPGTTILTVASGTAIGGAPGLALPMPSRCMALAVPQQPMSSIPMEHP